jgi:erythromycin esterase
MRPFPLKRTANRIISLHIVLLSITNLFAQDTVQLVSAWFKQNSYPIKYIEPGNGFADLQLLKQTLKNVNVIGLGEATHGTHEFFKIKQRIIEFLVTQMNFTAFVLESSYAACQPINDYILYGKGDRATVLTGQGYTPWDSEEFSDMVDWMRAYNKNVSDEKKIRFYGMDLWYNGLGRERVLAYLEKYAPEKIVSADSLFLALSSEEAKWPSRLDQSKMQESYIPLQQLVSYFNTSKSRLIAASNSDEWDRTYHHLQVMEYWLLANLEDAPPSLHSKKLARDDYMGQNMLYLIDKERPKTKFIIWAYNDHIAVDSSDGEESPGYQMRKWFGDKYYALALACYEGTFQTRILLPDKYWGALKIDTIPPFEKSINWYLHSTNKKQLLIDFRASSSNSVVEKWLETSQKFSYGVWLFRGASATYGELNLKGKYDGVLFIEQSTPIHPTRNALEKSSKNGGF